jgi:hypothetical protein
MAEGAKGGWQKAAGESLRAGSDRKSAMGNLQSEIRIPK